MLSRRTFLASLPLLVACAGGARSAGRPARSRSDVITSDEIHAGQWANSYDLIESLRPRWLRAHGPDTILGDPVPVQVHMDELRLGGIESLRAIPVASISNLQFIDPVTAAGRWGSDHANGAILITTLAR